MSVEEEPCPLCYRVGATMSRHHLIPKSQGGIEVELICSDCHSAIHARYSNQTLAKMFYSLELLAADEDLAKAFKFNSKQKLYRRFRSKRSKDKNNGTT